jgi:hypothetical protein
MSDQMNDLDGNGRSDHEPITVVLDGEGDDATDKFATVSDVANATNACSFVKPPYPANVDFVGR